MNGVSLFNDCQGSRPDFNLGQLSLSDRSFLILYATETGTALDIAEKIARDARRKRFNVTVCGFDEYNVADLVSETIVVFVVSTTGQGEFPTAARPFWQFLLRQGLPDDILEDLSFAIFGLGDTKYEKFCWAARLLNKRLKGLGAREMFETGEGDESASLGIDGALNGWLDGFWEKMLQLMPMPYGITDLPRDEVLPPRFRIQFRDEVVADSQKPSSKDETVMMQGYQLATLVKNQRMTTESHFQDVRLFEFNGEFSYCPGDTVAILPQNDPAMVNRVLQRLGYEQGKVDTVLEISGPFSLPKSISSHPNVTLRTLLERYLDFTAVPTRTFFDTVRLFATNQLEREKLQEYAGYADDPVEGLDDMYDYAIRPRRMILEVLEEFKSIDLPIEYLFEAIPWIRERQFSIASSAGSTSFTDKIELAVAIVKYRTRMHKPRIGLCTNYLSKLPVGTVISIRVTKGSLHVPPPPTPLILVGPGTGCAVIRSIILSRRSPSSSCSAADDLVFLGFRSKSSDFLFSNDWNLDSTRIAFSRDQSEKRYVQHLIVDDAFANQVWKKLKENATVIISGSSGNMPEEVKKSLKNVCIQQGGMNVSQADRFVEMLKRMNRLQEDCW